MNRISFLLLVLEGVESLHGTSQLQPVWQQSWGIDLDYCDTELFALEMTKIILQFLILHPSTAFQTLVD